MFWIGAKISATWLRTPSSAAVRGDRAVATFCRTCAKKTKRHQLQAAATLQNLDHQFITSSYQDVAYSIGGFIYLVGICETYQVRVNRWVPECCFDSQQRDVAAMPLCLLSCCLASLLDLFWSRMP